MRLKSEQFFQSVETQRNQYMLFITNQCNSRKINKTQFNLLKKKISLENITNLSIKIAYINHLRKITYSISNRAG